MIISSDVSRNHSHFIMLYRHYGSRLPSSATVSIYLHTYMVLSDVQRTASTGMHSSIEARTQPQTALPS